MDIIRVCITSFCSLCILFLLTKLLGYRKISNLSMFDYVSGITIGSITAEMATALKDDWRKPLAAMIVYTLFSLTITILTNKSIRLRRILTGKTLILMDEGKIYYRNLKKAKIDINEFLVRCRQNGYFDIAQIQSAVLEPSGEISTLPWTDYRPITPKDLNMKTDKEQLVVNVIMEGKIMENNLLFINQTPEWLVKALKKQGVSSVEEVFLATYNGQRELKVYVKINKTIGEDLFQ